MSDADRPDLLSIREAAELLGVSVRTLRRWDASGKLRARRHPMSGYRVYDRAAIARLRGDLAGQPRAGQAARAPLAGGCIGRGLLIEEVEAALADNAVVTLWGPPGIGKTRVAQAIADRRTDGRSCFCDLTSASSAEELRAAVAAALATDRRPGRGGSVDVARLLADRGPMLVVLDNFEHLVHWAADTVGAWRAAAPDARFLVTSRERLALTGERAFELTPLAEADAIALFESRALEAGATGDQLVGQRDAVRAICSQLDHLPLAIELAAGQTRLLSPRDIVDRLDRLGGGVQLARRSRDGTPRHQSLEAALAWSWQLLDSHQQAALRQCALFRGGFDLAAAEAVITLEGDDPPPVVEVLDQLHERSLLQVARASDGVRFDLFAVVRDFAEARLDPAERGAAARRHADHYLASFGGTISRRAVDLDRLARERGNLLAIWQRAADPVIGGRALVILDPLLGRTGPAAWHVSLLDQALDAVPVEHPALRARLLAARAHTAAALGTIAAAEADIDEVIALAALADARDAHADALLTRGWVWGEAGRGDEAAVQFERAGVLYRSLGDRIGEGGAINDHANALYRQGKLDEALTRYREALAMFESVGDDWNRGRVLGNIALAEQQLGNLDAAEADFSRSLELLRGANDLRSEAITALNLGELELDRDRTDRAEELFELALARGVDVGLRDFAPYPVLSLAWLEIGRDELEQAQRRANHALAMARELGAARVRGLGYLALGVAELLAGDTARAEATLEAGADALESGGDRRYAGLSRGFRAAALAIAGRAAEAGEVLDRASSAPPIGGTAGRCLTAIERALAGAPAEPGNAPPAALRVALRAADRVRAALRGSGDRDAIQVELGPELHWLIAGGRRIDLARRKIPRRVLGALVDAHRAEPGRAVSIDDLFAAGWPDEQMMAESARHRLHNTISSLRSAGLGDLIVRDGDGYRLDRAVVFATENG